MFYTNISTNNEQEKKGKICIYYLHFIKNEMLNFRQKFLKEMLSEKQWVGQKVHSGSPIKCYGNFWPTQYFLVPYESVTFLVVSTKIIFFRVLQYIKKAQILFKQGKIKAVPLSSIKETTGYQVSPSERDILS